MMASCSRWAELSERQLLDEPLTEGELRFLTVHEGACEPCRRDAALLRDLRPSALHAAPTDHDVERILAAAERGAIDTRLSPNRAYGRRTRLLAAAGFLSLAAGVLLFWTKAGAGVGHKATAPAALTEAVRTEADSCGELVEGVVVCLTAGSEVRRIELSGPQRGLDLRRGRALISITTPADRASFAVSTAAGTVLGSGGIFSVEARADGRAEARAIVGLARVRRHDAPAQTLLAGQALRLGQGSVTTISREEAQRELELLERWNNVKQPARP